MAVHAPQRRRRTNVALARLAESGEGPRRRVARAADEIEQFAVAALRPPLGDLRGGHGLAELAAAAVAGEPDAYAAADELLATVGA